jgi:hypothetical protein
MQSNVATNVLSSDKVLLQKLTTADAAFFYNLYARPGQSFWRTLTKALFYPTKPRSNSPTGLYPFVYTGGQ